MPRTKRCLFHTENCCDGIITSLSDENLQKSKGYVNRKIDNNKRMSLIDLCVERSESKLSLEFLKNHNKVEYGICQHHQNEHKDFDSFDDQEPHCCNCNKERPKSKLRFPSSEVRDFINIETGENVSIGQVVCKECIAEINKTIEQNKNEKKERHMRISNSKYVLVESTKSKNDQEILRYFIETHQERKGSNNHRTTHQKRKLMEKRRALMEVTTLEVPNLKAEYEQLKYELKWIKRKMKEKEITIPAGISHQKAKELIVKLGIDSRSKVYAFVGFLFKTGKYDGTASDMWKELQEYKTDYTAIKTLFDHKRYNVVFLKSIEAAMDSFFESKINSTNSKQTIWVHPHMMKREIEIGDFVKFKEDEENNFGVIIGIDEPSSNYVIKRYVENIEDLLVDTNDDFAGIEGMSKESQTCLVEKKNVTKVAPCLQFNLFLDHTTEGNLGMQNFFLGSLNSLNPSAKHNCIPVCSHDQSDNFEATKVVAEEPISQINKLIKTPPIFTLSHEQELNSSEETYSYSLNKQPDFVSSTFCNTCHENTKNCKCVENSEFFCDDNYCSKHFETEDLLKTHKLLDHTKNFNPKVKKGKKRKIKDLDERLSRHLENAKKTRLSNYSNLESDHVIKTKSRTTTITPFIVESTKNIFNWK